MKISLFMLWFRSNSLFKPFSSPSYGWNSITESFSQSQRGPPCCTATISWIWSTLKNWRLSQASLHRWKGLEQRLTEVGENLDKVPWNYLPLWIWIHITWRCSQEWHHRGTSHFVLNYSFQSYLFIPLSISIYT